MNYNFDSLCRSFNGSKRLINLSQSVVTIGMWLTILYHSAKKFDMWNTNLTHCVERFVAKKNPNLVSQCGIVCDLNYNLVKQCRKLWEVILNFGSQWRNLCEVNHSFVSQRHNKRRFEKQVCLTVTKNLRAESKIVSQCPKVCEANCKFDSKSRNLWGLK